MKDRNEIMRFFGLHPQNDVRRKFAFTLAEGATHVDNSNNKRRFAFTLAEVLVTLGIIGVVAVLTVPNVISSYQKKVYVTQLQKAYNEISNAFALLMIDEEVDNLNDSSLGCVPNTDYESRMRSYEVSLKKYFKVSKSCILDYADRNCTVDNHKLLDGTLRPMDEPHCCIVLNSGATLCLSSYGDCSRPLQISLDINGKKKPNVWGRDTFKIGVNYRGEIAESFEFYPNHMDPELNHFNDPNECFKYENYGSGCFTRIINAGWKMDY